MLTFDRVIVILRKFFNGRRFFCLATTCTIFQRADKSIIFLPCICYLENISSIPPPPMGRGGSILGSRSISSTVITSSILMIVVYERWLTNTLHYTKNRACTFYSAMVQLSLSSGYSCNTATRESISSHKNRNSVSCLVSSVHAATICVSASSLQLLRSSN